MKILPLAADSLGVRSMATFVETDDITIIVDPGVSLGPIRYELPPHPVEIERMQCARKDIINFIKKAKVVIITHYHLDHYMPEYSFLFKGKEVFLKNPFEEMNYNQRERGKEVIEILKKHRIRYEFADGMRIRYADTLIEFSPPFPHGTKAQGSVLSIYIKEKIESFLYTSDVVGPQEREVLEFIGERRPTYLYIDGPNLPFCNTYSLEIALKNLFEASIYTQQMILDHHPIRDKEYYSKLNPIFETQKTLTVAEFLHTSPMPLEARRKELFLKYVDKN